LKPPHGKLDVDPTREYGRRPRRKLVIADMKPEQS
jgi:hypothetical protein